MNVYILYLLLLFLSALITGVAIEEPRKRARAFLLIAFTATFLLYSLRASSVGRDLPGYERMYLASAKYEWFDFSYVYFEPGYIILTKLCSSLGIPFQMFLTFVNAIILIPIFIFILRYSENVFLSVLIYVCYTFFEFNMTGIRQAIASSIVLIAFMLLLRSRRLGIVKYILIVMLAATIHRGASVAFIYVPFHYMKKVRVFASAILFITIFSFVFRNQVVILVGNLIGRGVTHANFVPYFGLNLFFLIGCGILFALASRNNEIKFKTDNSSLDLNDRDKVEIARFSTKIFYLGIATALFFGYDTAARAYMFFCQVILVLLPNSIVSVFQGNFKVAIIVICVIFFIIFFVINTLIPNSFDIIPYTFFWQK